MIRSLLRIVAISLSFVLAFQLYGVYKQMKFEYGFDHPTLPIKAQPALCDIRVWFEHGNNPSYKAAFDKFTELTGIPWMEVEYDWDATILVSRIEGQNTTLLGSAHRSYGLEWRTRIYINEWGLPNKLDRAKVMLHEILHIFGLYHSPQDNSLMHEKYNPEKYLTDKDVANIKMLSTTCPNRNNAALP